MKERLSLDYGEAETGKELVTVLFVRSAETLGTLG